MRGGWGGAGLRGSSGQGSVTSSSASFFALLLVHLLLLLHLPFFFHPLVNLLQGSFLLILRSFLCLSALFSSIFFINPLSIINRLYLLGRYERGIFLFIFTTYLRGKRLITSLIVLL